MKPKTGYGFVKNYKKSDFRREITIQKQIKLITKYAARKEIQLIKIYEDVDTNDTDITVLNQVLRQLNDGECLIVHDIRELPYKNIHSFKKFIDILTYKNCGLLLATLNYRELNPFVLNMAAIMIYPDEFRDPEIYIDNNCDLCKILANPNNIITKGNQITFARCSSEDNPKRVIIINNSHRPNFFEFSEKAYEERLEDIDLYVIALLPNDKQSKYYLTYFENKSIEHSYIEYTQL